MTYKELKSKTGIKAARLKRYGRMFLNEDPLSGLRCGRARELTNNEAWILYVVFILYEVGCSNIKQLLEGMPDEGIWKISKFFQICTLHINVDLLREEFNSL